MIHKNENYKLRTNNTFSVLIGTLLGGLAGAVTMLLLAPQSGKETRVQLREKGIELSDRASELLEDTLAQVRTNASKITMGVKNYGQELAVEQLDHVSDTAQAGKKAIQNL